MPLQGVDKRGKKRDEGSGADAVGGVPGQEQCVLDFWPVMARTPVPRSVQHFLRMIEQLHP